MNNVRRLEYRNTAIGDLDKIYESVLDISSSEKIATNIVRKIVLDIERLSFNPKIGRNLTNGFEGVEMTPYYRLISGKHIVIYQFDDDAVYIVWVVRGDTDYINRIMS